MKKQLTYDTWSGEQLKIPFEDDTKGAIEVLQWAYDEYGKSIVYACSLGAEGMVLIDLISKVKDDAKVVFLDTNVHFKETYELIDKVKKKYPKLNFVVVEPEITLDEQALQYGEELWKTNPNQCCHLRKVIPLQKALEGSTAWITGLRRDQSPTRSKTEFINKDEKFKSIKVCPLIHWTWKDVWRYIYKHDLPYNLLHDQGYPSIGCEKCTLPTNDATNLRAGRWASLEKTECGLHQT